MPLFCVLSVRLVPVWVCDGLCVVLLFLCVMCVVFWRVNIFGYFGSIFYVNVLGFFWVYMGCFVFHCAFVPFFRFVMVIL